MGFKCRSKFKTGRAIGGNMAEKKYAAIVLSAGRGKRMNSTVPKQYLLLKGKPVLYYSLLEFEKSMVDEIILVIGKEEVSYCQKEIVEKYNIKKVKAIVPGGKERYHSVFCGLQELEKRKSAAQYVMIHDGARPFIDNEIIKRCAKGAEEYKACVAGMPVKDTIKIADKDLFAVQTPERNNVWMVQTPQAFERKVIWKAYKTIIAEEQSGKTISVTDDAMVVETMTEHKVKMVLGSYENIKITTPEDLEIAQVFCDRK